MIKSLLFAFILIALISCRTSKILYVEEAEKVNLIGSAIDINTDEAVKDLTIYVAGTQASATTNDNGKFKIHGIPEGIHKLYAHNANYTSMIREVNLLGNENEYEIQLLVEKHSNEYGELETRLKKLLKRKKAIRDELERVDQEIKSLPHLLITENKPDSLYYTESISVFKKYFLGDEKENHMELLNPNDLNIIKNDEARGSFNYDYSTVNPLIILNNHLGYKVTLHIEKLNIRDTKSGIVIEKDYHPTFREMATTNKNQAKKWRENRLKAFLGSLRHFLYAIASHNSVKYYGFEISRGTDFQEAYSIGSEFNQLYDVLIPKEEIYKPTNNPLYFTLEFLGTLKIRYKDKFYDNFFSSFSGLNIGQNQASWIKLPGGSTEFTARGVLVDKEAIEVAGFWHVLPLSLELPVNYFPAGNTVSP